MKTFSRNVQQSSRTRSTPWDFLTNHAHVLTCVAGDPGIRLRDIAAAVGITERAAHRIVSELVDEGYVLREREGRRNRYQVVAELPLRHPLVQEREVGDLLGVLVGSGWPATPRSTEAERSDREVATTWVRALVLDDAPAAHLKRTRNAAAGATGR